MRTTRKPSEPMLETFSAMYRFIPWIRAVTAISVVVARMIPSSVRKLRSLFLRSESTAIRVASQNDADRRNFRVSDTGLVEEDGSAGEIVPGKWAGFYRPYSSFFFCRTRHTEAAATVRKHPSISTFSPSNRSGGRPFRSGSISMPWTNISAAAKYAVK